jgi:hypothetical protein
LRVVWPETGSAPQAVRITLTANRLNSRFPTASAIANFFRLMPVLFAGSGIAVKDGVT